MANGHDFPIKLRAISLIRVGKGVPFLNQQLCGATTERLACGRAFLRGSRIGGFAPTLRQTVFFYETQAKNN
jgi:hypothetical protein